MLPIQLMLCCMWDMFWVGEECARLVVTLDEMVGDGCLGGGGVALSGVHQGLGCSSTS